MLATQWTDFKAETEGCQGNSRKEVFSFSIARKLLGAFEGTQLEMDMTVYLSPVPRH